MSTPEPHIIKCRAQLDASCYHGRNDEGLVNPDQSWWDDITWRDEDSTIICDACYIKLCTFMLEQDISPDNVEAVLDSFLSGDYLKPRGLRAVSLTEEPDPDSRVSRMCKRAIVNIQADEDWKEGDRIVVLMACNSENDDDRVEAGIGIQGYENQLTLFEDLTSHYAAITEAVTNA